MRPALLALLLASFPAWGQDTDDAGEPSLLDIDIDIDLSSSKESVTFQGDYSQKSKAVPKNQSINIVHNGGNITVRCLDTEVITSRVIYSVDATTEAAASTFGKGVRMSTNTSWVKVITPYKNSKINHFDVNLTVSVPPNAVVTASSTGGWVQAMGCDGFVTINAGKGGAYVDGDLEGFRVRATTGDAKVVVNNGKIKKNSAITASKGKVDLEWPAGQSVRLSAKGSSVSIAEPIDGEKSPTSINGTLGEGGPSLTISAGDEVVIKDH